MGWGGRLSRLCSSGGQHLFLTYEDQAVPVVWAAICKQDGVGTQLEACGGPLAKILFLSTTMASAAARLAASRISSSTRFAHLCTTTGWQPASLAWHTIARMHAAQMAVHPQAPGGLAGRLLPRVLPQAGHTIGRFLPGPGARPAPEGPLMAAPSVCPSVPPHVPVLLESCFGHLRNQTFMAPYAHLMQVSRMAPPKGLLSGHIVATTTAVATAVVAATTHVSLSMDLPRFWHTTAQDATSFAGRGSCC